MNILLIGTLKKNKKIQSPGGLYVVIGVWIRQFMRVLSAAFLSLLCVFCLFCLCFSLFGLICEPLVVSRAGLCLLRSSGVWRGVAEVNVWAQEPLRALGRMAPGPHDGCWPARALISHLTSLSAFICSHALESLLAMAHSLCLSLNTSHLKQNQSSAT